VPGEENNIDGDTSNQRRCGEEANSTSTGTTEEPIRNEQPQAITKGDRTGKIYNIRFEKKGALNGNFKEGEKG